MIALRSLTLSLLSLSVVACAGRAPAPVAVVQPTDNAMDCSAMMAEVSSNNGKISDLGGEKGAKVAQNVAAGVVGLVVWPVWFLMDFQGAAGTEIKALQDRNTYLATKINADGCSKAPASGTVTATAEPATAPAYLAPPVVHPPPATATAPAYSAPSAAPSNAPLGYPPHTAAPYQAPISPSRTYSATQAGAPAFDPYAIDPYPLQPASVGAPAAAGSGPTQIVPIM